MEKQMINLSELLDRAKKKALEKPDNKDGYAPKSTDELRFKRKHVVNTTSDANKNGDDVFKGTSVKAVDRAGTRFGYNPGQDEEVYEEVKKKKVCKESAPPDKKMAMAMAHKNRASKALEANDMKSFHHHMANHHESMGKWHESKGRHSAADREYDRAVFHTDFSAFYANPEEYRKNFEKEKEVYEEVKKSDRLAAIAAAAKKKNAQIGKTVVTGSKGGVGGAETRRYPAGTLKNSHEQVDEVLKPSMGAGAYISDFVHSKNPKFAGKSKKERMKQALAAFYSAKKGD
jgi:hypothetical protein